MALSPRLIAISDVARYGVPRTLRCTTALFSSAQRGSCMLMLRDHALGGREKLALARQLDAVANDTGQMLCVNDRLDLALDIGVTAVHLGEGSVDPVDARRLLGAQSFLSRAVHDPRLVSQSQVDAVLLSPIVASRKNRPPLGVEALHSASLHLSKTKNAPFLYALGGIRAEHVEACLSAGAWGVAAIGAVFGEGSPGDLLDVLKIRLS